MKFTNGLTDTRETEDARTSGNFIMNSGAYANKGTYLIEF